MLVTSQRRTRLLTDLAARIGALPPAVPVRVAVDGVDGAGKTTFADELGACLRRRGRAVVRVSVDGFHRPQVDRYRLGRDSPEGFYRDSYDYDALGRLLLDPLGPGGSGRFRRAAFDHRTDRTVTAPEESAGPGTVLLLDGIFLHRPQLRACWDFSVFLRVDFDVSIPRCAARGDGTPDPMAPSNRRYVAGQRLYFREAQPWVHATVVVDNNDFAAPRIAAPATARRHL